MSFERSSGLLLHPTSLPGKYGIGTLGKAAFEFINFLIKSGQKLWQVYPLGPTGYGDSPYQCFSAFAGNPLLIDLDILKEEGFISDKDFEADNIPSDNKNVDYGHVIYYKMPILKKAFEQFNQKADFLYKSQYENFLSSNSDWLKDYSLFMAIKSSFGGKSWVEWDEDIKLRKSEAIEKYSKELKDEIEFQNFIQFLFFKQWGAVKAYANQNGIKVIGDIPIFVAFDSSDAWANSDMFLFNEDRKPVKVAGVPPDYFSATGQLWGNPLYNWETIGKDNYKWWIERIKANLKVADIIRIDHFRGFEAYWAVPADEDTAINGTWEKGPDIALFNAIKDALGTLPIIAEDLGLITPEVEKLRDDAGFPGMKILQFAFDSKDENDYLPHNYTTNSVVYTGTHDNDTIVGWFNTADKDDKQFAIDYLEIKDTKNNIAWNFIKAAWASVSVMAIAPIQDLLELGTEARINTPGKAAGNWQWRLQENDLTDELAKKLRKLTKTYCR